MDWLKPISRYLIVPLFARRNRHTDYKYVEEAERNQYLQPALLEEHRLAAAKRLLCHARDHVPFYAKRFADCGFDPDSFRGWSDLSKVPPLTKADIQRNLEDMTAKSFDSSQLILNQTGGSTGAPLKFYMNADSVYRRRANTIRHDSWAGLHLWDKGATLWGARADFIPTVGLVSRVRNTFIDRRVVLDTSDISAPKLSGFVRALDEAKPEVYVAYANAMFLVARYIEEKGLRDYHRPRSIISSAEVLTPEMRETIERVFECKVFNRYGCREVSVIASECEAHDGMHVAADTLYLEFLKDGKPCADGEQGHAHITDLYNYGMPLIRYRIEDMGSSRKEACTCGRQLPMMNMVGGRVTDFLVAPDGTVVSGAAMTIYFVARIPGVSQAQLEQDRRDHLIVRIIKDERFGSESETAIKESVAKFFGAAMTWDIDVVDALPSTASGKHRFSICHLDPLEFMA